MASVVVLDAGALIALYDSTDKHHEWALSLFRETLGYEMWMSALTYAEVLVHPIRAQMADTFDKGVSGLNISIRSVHHVDARALASLRATTSLKMPNALVLHLAESEGASLATTDKVLGGAARARLITVFEPATKKL